MTIRQYLCLLIPFGMPLFLSAQYHEVEEYAARGWRTNKTAMTVLGGWAAGNMITSGILMEQHRGSERAFHQMNIGWNVVNLGIAGLGYWHSVRQLARPPGHPGAMLRQQQKIRQSLLFNAGLDLAYVTAGAWMIDRGRRPQQPDARLEGFGKSLLLQGGFLFVFDLTFFLIHDRRDNRLFRTWTLSPQGMGLVLNKAW